MTITQLHHSEESSELSGVELNEFKGEVTKTLAGHSVSLERHGKGRKREERSSVSVPDQPASLKRRLMAGLKWFTTTLLELEAIAVSCITELSLSGRTSCSRMPRSYPSWKGYSVLFVRFTLFG